jgi:Uri superfamily endonuclease
VPHPTYQLVIELRGSVRCVVGKLGVCSFPQGRYVYTGSAKRNLPARVARHLAMTKCLHWHIDYLLARTEARVIEVRTFARAECKVNRHTPGRIIVAGFGSSDCRSGCGAHLKFLGHSDQ